MLHSQTLAVGNMSVDGALITPRMRLLSIVIPALNEAENIPKVLATIPLQALEKKDWEVEFLVVDNGSVDGTGRVAAAHNARVVQRSVRGYGSAYRAGLAAARGELIVTGDADCTYPFDAIPELLEHFEKYGLEFLSTNRLGTKDRLAMKQSHMYANHALTGLSRTLFRSPFRDSQSGMWIFRREILDHLDLRSNGMAFSQEIKHEAYLKGFRCGEVAIEYRVRGGSVKLNAWRDGVVNASQLFSHRVRGRGPLVLSVPTVAQTTLAAKVQLESAAHHLPARQGNPQDHYLGQHGASLPEPSLMLATSPDVSPHFANPLQDRREVSL